MSIALNFYRPRITQSLRNIPQLQEGAVTGLVAQRSIGLAFVVDANVPSITAATNNVAGTQYTINASIALDTLMPTISKTAP